MKKIKCTNSKECMTDDELETIAEAVENGELIVYPTETVYGIGADIFNEAAIKKLFVAKNRPFDMPLSVAVSSKEMMDSIAVLDERAERLIDAFLPGPLTIIIKKKPIVPDIVTSMSEKVGIRMPDHPVALKIIERTGPLVATSANSHSHPDAVNSEEAESDFGDSVNVYVDSGPCSLGKPSTIVWLMGDKMEIVRQGAITRKQIEDVLNA